MERAGTELGAYPPVSEAQPASQHLAGRAARPGTLTIAAAPIGQPDDASARLREALAEAAVIAAEDTRRLRRLASVLGVAITGRIVSYYDDVESRRVPGLIGDLQRGLDVLLVTDAGMPGVSDPGYRLITSAIGAGIAVTVLPGPSAVTAALVVSGLPCDRFVFEGFPPRRAGQRTRRFADLATEPRTLVLFESPRRAAATLAELAAALGSDRRAAICRELTKTHEEVCRGTLGELAEYARGGLLGEVTLVIAGRPHPAGTATPQHAAVLVAEQERNGLARKDAIAVVAKELGLARRAVYDAVVSNRNQT
jgi:16S rRNA (cytidine1402-2'-O)-methyltransferase